MQPQHQHNGSIIPHSMNVTANAGTGGGGTGPSAAVAAAAGAQLPNSSSSSLPHAGKAVPQQHPSVASSSSQQEHNSIAANTGKAIAQQQQAQSKATRTTAIGEGSKNKAVVVGGGQQASQQQQQQQLQLILPAPPTVNTIGTVVPTLYATAHATTTTNPVSATATFPTAAAAHPLQQPSSSCGITIPSMPLTGFSHQSLLYHRPHQTTTVAIPHNHHGLINMQTTTIPAVAASTLFGNSKKLRSGKWLKEEEEYSDALIALFEKGHLTDCENGSTLRAYLSRKLNCPPMRISKKYARKGIGKMVFLSKIGTDISPQEQHIVAAGAREKEQRFYKASFPSLQFMNPQFAVSSVGPTLVPPSVHMIPGLAPSLGVMPFHPTTTTTTGAVTSVVGTSTAGQTVLPSAVTPAAVPRLTTTTNNLPGSGSQPATTLSVVDQKTQLRQSYLKALGSGQVSITTSSNNQNDLSTTGSTLQQQGKPPGSNAPSHQVSGANPAVHVQGSAPNHAQTGASGPMPWRPPEPLHRRQQSANAPAAASTTSSATTASHTQTFVVPLKDTSSQEAAPDFLSGFDKVNPNAKAANAAAISHSPGLTSRSFDDFHRFLLGKDGDQNVFQAGPRLPDRETASSQDTTAANAAFNADSYALFAVESAAVAASQHAAYLPTGAMMGPTQNFFNKPINESFDHNRVAEHVGGLKASAAPTDKPVGSSNTATQAHPKLEPSSTNTRGGPAPNTHAQSACIPSTQMKSLLERLQGSLNAAVVSASEPSATESSSSAPQSGVGSSDNGSSNDSDDASSNGSEGNHMHSSSDSSSDSGSEGPKRKKLKTSGTTTDNNVGSKAAGNSIDIAQNVTRD